MRLHGAGYLRRTMRMRRPRSWWTLVWALVTAAMIGALSGAMLALHEP